MPDAASLPILFSFRRCPYAIRARLALRYARIPVELREVSLAAKPQEMLQYSPKGTVPVLVLSDVDGDQTVLEESLDIMHWALDIRDPEGWRDGYCDEAGQLIERNDSDFKYWLDRYKYPNRFDLDDVDAPLTHCNEFLHALERRLLAHRYLFGDRMTLADVGIFPFVRQFAFVDRERFDETFGKLRPWLESFLESGLFNSVMQKYPLWEPGSAPQVFK